MAIFFFFASLLHQSIFESGMKTCSSSSNSNEVLFFKEGMGFLVGGRESSSVLCDREGVRCKKVFVV